QGPTVLLEIGPKPTLLEMGKAVAGDRAASLLWLPSLRRPGEDSRQMLESLAALYGAGADIDWRGFYRESGARPVAPPTYPFQRQHYWINLEREQVARAFQASDRLKADATLAHPLLGSRVRSPLKEVQYERALGTRTVPYLDDHRIYGTPVLPATGYVEM